MRGPHLRQVVDSSDPRADTRPSLNLWVSVQAVRAFVVVGILVLTAASVVAVQGVLYLKAAMNTTAFTWEFWTSDFWLLAPSDPERGLGPNAGWFMRLVASAFLALVGWVVLKASK